MSKTRRRLPAPDELKLGTRVHKVRRNDIESEDIVPAQCAECAKWYEMWELDDDKLCSFCTQNERNNDEENLDDCDGDVAK